MRPAPSSTNNFASQVLSTTAPGVLAGAQRAVHTCRAVPAEDVGYITKIGAPHYFTAGRTLLTEGEPASRFAIITEGAVKIYKLMLDGRRQITGFLFAGDLLGLTFAPDYSYSADALTEVRLCLMPRSQFERLLDQHPAMARHFLALASTELAAAQTQMVLLGRKCADEKIASFILMLSDREYERDRNGAVVALPMTRTDIADYLGLTTETVSRTFTRLKNSGWIALETPGSITILDHDALTNLAEGGEMPDPNPARYAAPRFGLRSVRHGEIHFG